MLAEEAFQEMGTKRAGADVGTMEEGALLQLVLLQFQRNVAAALQNSYSTSHSLLDPKKNPRVSSIRLPVAVPATIYL